jgi:hypothetical protein
MGNGQQHDEAPTKSYTSVKRPQEDKTVGIALIVTNGYEGPRYKLPGTRDDHEKWTRALETLKFDIRSIRNESKANTLEFFRVASTIPVDGKCRYLVFVFAGHGRKGVVYSQDMQEINLQKELLPHLFLHGNFRSVEKLIFLDACRNEDKDKERLSLSDSLVHVWGPGSGAAGYFSFCATPSLYKARGGLSGSAFSDSVTKKIITRVSLPNLVDEVRTELREEAQSQEIEYINPVYEDNLTAGSEKILLNLQSTQGSTPNPLASPSGPQHSTGSPSVKMNNYYDNRQFNRSNMNKTGDISDSPFIIGGSNNNITGNIQHAIHSLSLLMLNTKSCIAVLYMDNFSTPYCSVSQLIFSH